MNDISAGIGVSEIFIKDLGLSQGPARSTMSDGNKKRDWRVFESLYNRLLSHYKSVLKKHHDTHIIEEIKGKVVKLIDSSTISLCLSMYDWAEFRMLVDQDKKSFLTFTKDYPWISYCDFQGWDGKAVNDYHVFATPTMFLLDNNRRILVRPVSAQHANVWIEQKL